MSSKEFTARDIRKIALDYIFSKDSSYKKLAEKYDCSSSKISTMMNYDLLYVSRLLYLLAEIRARYNRKKNMRKYFSHK